MAMRKVAMSTSQKYFQTLLHDADIIIGGNRPCDIQVKNPRFFERVLAVGTLGLGESYMDGWWECEALDEFFCKVLQRQLNRTIRFNTVDICRYIQAWLHNRQNRRRVKQVGEQHYDTGNDLFSLMLDKNMAYSCGYWQNASTLDEAQDAKLDMICRKLQLKPGMRLLDIGCGWGSMVRYAAEKYGVEAVGITVSEEQVQLARERCEGLQVEIRLQDYRELKGKFDAIVSVGMFEHVGYKNYRTFMEIVRKILNDNGLFLLHTIATNHTSLNGDPWFDKYIFPNGMLPSAKQLTSAIEHHYVLEDWHNFGVYYDQTLMAWFQNFRDNWPKLHRSYGDHFYRMWSYYLLCMAGCFRARYLHVWQVVLAPNTRKTGYPSIRCPACIT
nr:cyclopropane fatty acyl phospholipid synthase [Desulfopila aestuarii]